MSLAAGLRKGLLTMTRTVEGECCVRAMCVLFPGGDTRSSEPARGQNRNSLFEQGTVRCFDMCACVYALYDELAS